MAGKAGVPRPRPADHDETEWGCAACEWTGPTAAGLREHLGQEHAMGKERVDALRRRPTAHLDAAEWSENVVQFSDAEGPVAWKRDRRGRRRADRAAGA